MALEANPGCCQEQADHAPSWGYFPCNKPSDGKLYRQKYTGEGPYRFCEMHAWHSVQNRNFEEVKDGDEAAAAAAAG
jgi:hypothetical protein